MATPRLVPLLFLLATLAQAEPPLIRVQLEYIATDLITSRQAVRSIAPYPLLLQKLQEGKARRYNTEVLTTQDGAPGSVESIWEVIYPTELLGDGVSGSVTAAQRQRMDRFWRGNLLPRPIPFIAFETRNIGFTLESQASSHEGTIEIRLAAEDDQLQRMETFLVHKDHWGRSDPKFPLFATKRSHTSLLLNPNSPLLIATYSPLQESGLPDPTRPVLLFVTASLLTLP